jgi:hypothetical protein
LAVECEASRLGEWFSRLAALKERAALLSTRLCGFKRNPGRLTRSLEVYVKTLNICRWGKTTQNMLLAAARIVE